MSRKKISTTIYVTPEQNDRLKLLHERTKVPVAVYIREGIDLVLRHYAHLLPGQLPLDAGRGNRAADKAPADRASDHRLADRTEKTDRSERAPSERHSSSKLDLDDDKDEKAAAGSKK
jgi:hypothetical protein